MSADPHAAGSRIPTDRRTFLKTAGAAAAAVAVGPMILGAANKSGSRRRRRARSARRTPMILGAANKSGSRLPVLGEGDFAFECHHGWGEVPSHIAWGDTHGVCIDREGLIYIKHRSPSKEPMDAIAVFDADGRFVRSFGKEFHGGGHGIDVRREGGEEFLYLSCIGLGVVVKATLKGDVVWKKGVPQEPQVYSDPQNKYSPTNIAFAPDGGFYIGDGYGSHYIHQYDKDANWVRTFGGFGSEPGKLKTPHGLWLDNRPGREPSLVVADRANAKLQYFTLDGKHLSYIEGLLFPADIDIQGEVLLCPDLHARVSLYDKDNNVIAHLGDDAEWRAQALEGFQMRSQPERWQPGRFIHPHDACFDHDGNIFVVEWVATGRVTKLRKVA